MDIIEQCKSQVWTYTRPVAVVAGPAELDGTLVYVVGDREQEAYEWVHVDESGHVIKTSDNGYRDAGWAERDGLMAT